MRFAYVLPDPASYGRWEDFEKDLAGVRRAGFEAVELQLADPAQFDESRVRRSLEAAGLPLCAVQTGGSYASRGNCLCTANEAVRRRTVELLKAFVDLASRWGCLLVFGLLEGRKSDEPDRAAGEARIRRAIGEVGRYASERGATLLFEPVHQGESGFFNTIAEVAALVRELNLPGVRMMIDSFHMNLEERDPLGPLSAIRDLLDHVHLVETNRDVLGRGDWPTAAFLARLQQIGYAGYCSLGVYQTTLSRAECIDGSMAALRACGARLEARGSRPEF